MFETIDHHLGAKFGFFGQLGIGGAFFKVDFFRFAKLTISLSPAAGFAFTADKFATPFLGAVTAGALLFRLTTLVAILSQRHTARSQILVSDQLSIARTVELQAKKRQIESAEEGKAGASRRGRGRYNMLRHLKKVQVSFNPFDASSTGTRSVRAIAIAIAP
jgi:hypothetical protein